VLPRAEALTVAALALALIAERVPVVGQALSVVLVLNGGLDIVASPDLNFIVKTGGFSFAAALADALLELELFFGVFDDHVLEDERHGLHLLGHVAQAILARRGVVDHDSVLTVVLANRRLV